MQTITEPENITLYYRERASDKVYQCSIEPAGERFVVNFAYGRRGTTLNSGTKTNVPVEYDVAKRLFEKLIKEKKAKGYTEGEAGTPYQHSDKQSSGILPQLLNPIDESELPALLRDNAYVAQEKHDGRRLLICKQEVVIHGINKKGQQVGLPQTLFQAAQRIPGTFLIDGEAVGDKLYAFDLLEVNGIDLRAQPYKKRLAELLNLLCSGQQKHILMIESAFSPVQKAILLKFRKARKAEGLVFKRLDAPYSPGRPNSGGPQLKHKFVATLSAVVAKVNPQRSVELQLIGKVGWQSCGNVTIPANHPVPSAGQVVEIRYLYAFPESGVLFQPVFLGVRDDIDPNECVALQLKFKAQDTDGK